MVQDLFSSNCSFVLMTSTPLTCRLCISNIQAYFVRKNPVLLGVLVLAQRPKRENSPAKDLVYCTSTLPLPEKAKTLWPLQRLTNSLITPINARIPYHSEYARCLQGQMPLRALPLEQLLAQLAGTVGNRNDICRS